MGSTRAVAAALVLLVGVLPFLPVVVGTAGASNPHVVNDYLESVMATWPAGQDIEVLVRFKGEVTVYDTGHLERAGLSARHTFHVVPAVFAVGPVEAVWRASLDPRVEWIEWNRPLHYTQENSTYAVNATRVWNALIEDKSLQFPSIDGTGVTVVVVDSGVDAGHPDLDYGSKTIMNLKSDSNLAWFELENSDTSSGHGTHVAGTVAGNGDASAGARVGVAPGARLIALSTGEAVAIINALGALEWVYDHSRPGNNPFNIRCATNSWGTSGAPYDPNDSIAIVTEKLTYDNSVVVTFAAGNAGSNNHDGSSLTTNPYANTPAAISVAAYARDGSGLATFSSRGLAADNATWPDVGAPGVRINSTRARLTLITAEVCLSGGQCDPYYMAISGTSMATPHVAGEVALLFQAAPSLRVSDYHADFGSAANTTQDVENWFTNDRTRMHEVEVILKVTARFLANGSDSAGNDNGVPAYNDTTGLWGLPRDFAQGYGFADMNRAIALALTLQKLRSEHLEATVWDAYQQFEDRTAGAPKVAADREFAAATDTLTTSWKGEWSRYNDQYGKPILVHNSTKLVFIPNGTSEVHLDLTYDPINLDDLEAGTVGWQIDFQDGSPPMTSGPFGGNGRKTATLSSSQISGKTGATWAFSVVGFGLRWQDYIPPFQFKEVRVPYSFGVSVKIQTSPDAPFLLEFDDTHTMFAQWRFLENGSQGANGSIVMKRPVFDLTGVSWNPPRPGGGGGPLEVPWWAGLLAGLVLLGAGLWVYNRERVRRGMAPLKIMVWADQAIQRLKAGRLPALRVAGGRPAPVEPPAGGRGAGLMRRLRSAPSRALGAMRGLASRLPVRRPGKV